MGVGRSIRLGYYDMPCSVITAGKMKLYVLTVYLPLLLLETAGTSKERQERRHSLINKSDCVQLAEESLPNEKSNHMGASRRLGIALAAFL